MGEVKQQRTLNQNKALHLFFTWLSDSLNEAGLEVDVVLSQLEAKAPWTPATVKELLWRPFQKAITGKESTKDLTTDDPTLIHETLMRELGEKTGVEYIRFPNMEDLIKLNESLQKQAYK